MYAGVSFESGGRCKEGVRGAEPPPKGVGLPCSFDIGSLKHVGLLEHQGKGQLRRDCNGVARALVRAARALVRVFITVFLVPCVLACRFVSHTQTSSTASSCWRYSEPNHTTKAAERVPCSRWLAIAGVLSLKLPIYAAIPYPRLERRYRESMISCTRGVARHVMPPELGSKPQFRSPLELYRIGVWFCLVRQFPFEVYKYF